MASESLFNFPDEYLRTIRNASRNKERRVVVGFNENQFGEAVVTTAVPMQTQPDKVSYVKKKTMSYDDYMFSQQQKMERKR